MSKTTSMKEVVFFVNFRIIVLRWLMISFFIVSKVYPNGVKAQGYPADRKKEFVFIADQAEQENQR